MKHLTENNETYFGHLNFACIVGMTLIIRGSMFMVHGLFPVLEIPKRFNLENTFKKLKKWNEYAETRK